MIPTQHAGPTQGPDALTAGWLAATRQLDRRLFHWIGAGHRAAPLRLALAKAVARWSGLPLLGCLLVAVQQHELGLAVLVQCLLVATVVQWLSKRLSRHCAASRPFVEGLSPNHLNHSARAGFPSTHAMVMGALLGALALHAPAGPALGAVAATAVATGWARVYTGAHFPLDVLAGLALGCATGAALGAGMASALGV